MAAQLKTEFEYFQPEPILIQVDRSFYREYTPIFALQNNAPIDFSIPYSEQLYFDLSRIYLYVRAKITNEDGKKYSGERTSWTNQQYDTLIILQC